MTTKSLGFVDPRMNSVYAMRPGDPSVWGEFPAGSTGNTRLGYACDTRVERLDDGDGRARDILGYPMFRTVSAQHVSGLDRYGAKSHGGIVRELGLVTEAWNGHTETKAEAIVTTFSEEIETGRKLHIAQWSRCDGYLALTSLSHLFGLMTPFTAENVIATIERREERKARSWSLMTPQHLQAVTRWLEGMVGVTNLAAGAVPSKRYPCTGQSLVRVRRKGQPWRWEFRDAV